MKINHFSNETLRHVHMNILLHLDRYIKVRRKDREYSSIGMNNTVHALSGRRDPVWNLQPKQLVTTYSGT